MAALDPSSLAEFASRRLQATTAYDTQKAQNQFKLGATSSKYGLDTQALTGKFELDWGDLSRKWDQAREKLPGEFAGKNTLNSGIYTNALTNQATERAASEEQARFGYQTQSNQLNLQYQTDLGSLALDDQLANTAYWNAMVDLNQQQGAAEMEQDSKNAWATLGFLGKTQENAWNIMALNAALGK